MRTKGDIYIKNNLISEKSKKTPVVHETDICVIGGSCTGVFAAVRAAQLGAKVAIIEKQNSFGGLAPQGLFNIWHSLSSPISLSCQVNWQGQFKLRSPGGSRLSHPPRRMIRATPRSVLPKIHSGLTV